MTDRMRAPPTRATADPGGPDDAIERVRRALESSDAPRATIAALARDAGLSPWALQRRFKARHGVTPRDYAEAHRLRALRQKLRESPSVTDAIYDAGYGSGSRVYERVDTRLGMTPAQYRARGAGVAISYAAGDTVLGRILIGATDRGICFLEFGDDEDALLATLEREYPAATRAPMPASQRALFESWMDALARHLEAGGPLALPIDPRGTAFQLRVWKTLQEIPYGELASYAEVARRVGAPRATRAVARACAKNTIAIAIPCHRVIRGDGALGGYRWGEPRKRALIDREREVGSSR